MSRSSESQPSWGRFFGGCALVVLILGGGLWGLWSLRARKLETAQQVRQTVLQPYWDALPRADFAEVCAQLCTPERNRTAEPSVVAQRFADFTKAHGALKSVEIFSTTEGGVVGQSGQTMRVVVHMNFAKGRFLSLAYNLLRTDQQPWRIDSVTTSDREIAMPTF